MSLRTRLLGALAVLATIGLVVAGIVTYTQLRSFLQNRVDQQLAGSARVLARDFDPHTLGNLATLAPGTYRVAWHAVSVDTPRTEGAYSFTVKPCPRCSPRPARSISPA